MGKCIFLSVIYEINNSDVALNVASISGPQISRKWTYNFDLAAVLCLIGNICRVLTMGVNVCGPNVSPVLQAQGLGNCRRSHDWLTAELSLYPESQKAREVVGKVPVM